MKTWNLFTRSNLVIVDHDPEMADMVNPTGAIPGERFAVIAEDKRGSRFSHPEEYDTIGEAELALKKAESAILEFGLNPRHCWVLIDPCYGTEAYEKKELGSDLTRVAL